MIELWLLFSIGTILCYGSAQQFSKRGVQIIGVYQTGILYSVAALVIQSSFRILNPDDVTGDIADVGVAVFAGVVGALGFVFYVKALKSGMVSLVSVITAGYPAVAVVLAIALLQESLSIKEVIGIMLVILAIIFLALPQRSKIVKDKESKKSMIWLFWSVMAFIFWGVWAVPSKMAIVGLGEADFIFIDGLTMMAVWIPIWLYAERGKLSRDFKKIKYSSTAGVLASLGTVSLFLAFANGQVSIVTPLTSIYPLFTIVLARITLKERLDWLQFLAIALGLFGIVMLAS